MMSELNGAKVESTNSDGNNKKKPDFDTFSKNGFKAASMGIRNANALPTEGDWNFYKLNDSFNKIMMEEGNRLLRVMNNVLKKYNIDDSIKSRALNDKIELVVEGNDMILERVGDNIDEMNGIKKKNVQPVEIQMVSAQLPINGAWNRRGNTAISVSANMNLPAEKSNVPVAVHLLSGKNIIRPQTFFKDKIDNSNSYPWQPRIKEKPNSIRPLALYMEETKFGDTYCHPYETELEQFQPAPEQLAKENPVLPKSIKGTALREITTEKQLNELVDTLRTHRVIAVDLEHHSYRTFMGITCLMQISTVDVDYLIDTLELRDKIYVLNEIFTRPSIVKVFHGADCDVQWLQRDLSLYVVNMFDTHQAAKQLGYTGLSLSYLLQKFCGFEPNKHFQLADWRMRPLPEELKLYAREDTHYLIYIYQLMKNELLKRGNKGTDNLLQSVIQQSTEICKKIYFKPILKEESHLDFYRKCKRLFDNRQLYALKHLYNWRDKIAREEDESTGYVLPNHMLLQIAEVLPKEMQGILACCNPIPPLVRSNLLELHQFILKARDQSIVKPIMKEDNRSVGSTQQLSKINISSPLHCPHDLTNQVEFRDDLPTLLNNPGCRDLFHQKEKISLELKASKLSVFTSVEEPESNNTKTFSWTILSPFQRYKLVRPFVESEEKRKRSRKEGEEDIEKVKDELPT